MILSCTSLVHSVYELLSPAAPCVAAFMAYFFSTLRRMLFPLYSWKNSLPNDLTTVCQVTLQLRMAKCISTPQLFHLLNPSSCCCSQKFSLLDSASCSGCWMEENLLAGSPGWASGGTQLSAEPCLHNHQPPEEFSTCHRKGRNMHHVTLHDKKQTGGVIQDAEILSALCF